MPRKYPLVRDVMDARPSEPVECCACNKPAVTSVRVAWDYMRGNDEVEPACRRHFKMADQTPGRFIAHMLTKERHVKAAASS